MVQRGMRTYKEEIKEGDRVRQTKNQDERDQNLWFVLLTERSNISSNGMTHFACKFLFFLYLSDFIEVMEQRRTIERNNAEIRLN